MGLCPLTRLPINSFVLASGKDANVLEGWLYFCSGSSTRPLRLILYFAGAGTGGPADVGADCWASGDGDVVGVVCVAGAAVSSGCPQEPGAANVLVVMVPVLLARDVLRFGGNAG